MKKISCNKTFDKKQITKLIEWFLYNYGPIRTNYLVNRLKSIGFKYSTKAGLSLGPEDLKIPTTRNEIIRNTEAFIKKKERKYKLGKSTKQNLLQKQIETWNLTNNIIKDEIVKNFRQSNILNPVYMMIFSGARGNLAQIKQLIGMRGLMSDSKGEIINLPIKSNLKEGLKSKEYFISCYGARKGIIDTALKTANSGYLTRKLIYVAQKTTIRQQDCKTPKGILIKLFSRSKNNYLKLKTKIIGTILAEDIPKVNKKRKISKGQDICPYIAKNLIKNETYIYIRSVLTCKLNIGICQLCYGWDLGTNKLIRIGEAVGILAAQSIGEPGTQLTMRTFHTGGVFTSKTNKVITSPHQGTVLYNNKIEGKKIRNKFDERIFFLLKERNLYLKKNTKLISKILLPKYSAVYLKPGQNAFKKQAIAEITEWKIGKKNKKETKEIKSYNSGKAYFHSKKRERKVLFITNGNIIEKDNFFKKILNGQKYLTKLNIKSEKLKDVKNKKQKKNNLIKLSFEKSKFFKDHKKCNTNKKVYSILETIKQQGKIVIIKAESIQKIKLSSKKKTGLMKIGKFTNKRKGLVSETKKDRIKILKSIPYLIPKYSNLKVLNNEIIEKGTTIFKTQYEKEKTKDIIEGLPRIEEILEAKKTRDLKKIKGNVHEKLEKIFFKFCKKYNNRKANRKTIEKVQKILVNQIQKVYGSQDVNIAEKHIAIIVKQITSKALIREKGDSNIIEGELIDRNKIEKINRSLKRKALYEPVLIGISKASLLTEGFISAACFQETIRVLTKSAIIGKIDWLTGLKENLIMGNLIPSGTGVNPVTIKQGV